MGNTSHQVVGDNGQFDSLFDGFQSCKWRRHISSKDAKRLGGIGGVMGTEIRGGRLLLRAPRRFSELPLSQGRLLTKIRSDMNLIGGDFFVLLLA